MLLRSRVRWIIGLGTLIVVVALIAGATELTTPTHWPVTRVEGVDKYAWHRPFYGDTIISQSFVAASDTLSRIDVLIVDYKHTSPSADLTLKLYEQDVAEPLHTVTVASTNVKDDYYLPFEFPVIKDSRQRTYTFTLAAPGATTTAPYAVRYTEDKQSIAFAYQRSVPTAFLVQQWVVEHRSDVTALLVLLVLCTTATILLPWSARGQRQWLIALLLVLAVGTSLQLKSITQLTGAVGGDEYYYLYDAQRILHGINPLTISAYRVPFYPVLLLPAVHPTIPDLLWGRIVGIATTIGIGFALVWLARTIRLTPTVAITAMGLLYMNSEWLITTLRPRPYTFFSLLLLLATAALFSIRSLKHAALWGVLLGIMGMTRQEAYVPTALLGGAFVIKLIAQRTPLKQLMTYLAAAGVPLLLILSPYFYANAQQYGGPFTISQYTERDDLYIPTSLHAFWSGNLTTARDVLAAVWLPSSAPGVRRHAGGLFAGIMIVVGALYVTQRNHERIKLVTAHLNRWYFIESGAAAATIIIGVTIARWVLLKDDSWSQEINLVLMAAMVWGAVEIIRVGRWRGLLVLSILGSQLLIATLFHPAPKHYQQTYPLLALGLAAVLLTIAGAPTSTTTAPVQSPLWRQALRTAPVVALVAFLGTASIRNLGNTIDAHNYPAAAYFVTTSAAERLEHYPTGPTAAEVDYVNGDGIYRLHTYQQAGMIRFEEKLSPTEQYRWLCDHGIRYVVDHGDLDLFTIQTDDATQHLFKPLFVQATRGSNDRRYHVTVYEIVNAENCTKTASEFFSSAGTG